MNNRLRKLSVLKMLEADSRIAIQCIQTYVDLRKPLVEPAASTVSK